MPRVPVIAIDGPAGSGKSTLARRLAEELHLPYLNTGVMYRALTLMANHEGVDLDDGVALAALASRMTFDLNTTVHPPRLWIDGAEPAAGLSSREVESVVSQVARHPEVRAVLRAEQRRLSEGGGVIEGRDIGSVVAPKADVKIFLAAEETERIARRTHERGVGGDVGRSLSARDAVDAITNPLEPAPDAVRLDTTGLDPDQVFGRALDVIRARLAGGPG